MDCIRLAESYQNVWLEPSALGSSTSDPTGEVLIESYTKIQRPDSLSRSFTAVMVLSAQASREYLERSIVAMEASGYSVEGGLSCGATRQCQPRLWSHRRGPGGEQ